MRRVEHGRPVGEVQERDFAAIWTEIFPVPRGAGVTFRRYVAEHDGGNRELRRHVFRSGEGLPAANAW